MKPRTFPGGIHPQYHKERTSGSAVAPLPVPPTLYVPLLQHIGAPARAEVGPGDAVRAGQRIASPGGFVSAAVHAPAAGTVRVVDTCRDPAGRSVPCVVLDVDAEAAGDPAWAAPIAWEDAPADLLRERVADSGIVGMGGAAFPTHVKLSPPVDKPIDTVLINGAECEPFLTADHRVMVEHAADVVTGARILARILGASRVLIAVEVNKPDAIAALSQEASDPVSVLPLEVKYPQGGEKQLIKACLDREVPSGGLPMDVGVVVQNAGTAKAVHDAVTAGRPLIERVVTVSGDAARRPGNWRVPVGTPISALLEAADVDHSALRKLVVGGPMMGFAQFDADAVVTKGTSGVLALGAAAVHRDPLPCIRCARCVRACPMGLAPSLIAAQVDAYAFDNTEDLHAMDCIECGSCAHECPSFIPLVQKIRLAKAHIAAARNKRRAP